MKLPKEIKSAIRKAGKATSVCKLNGNIVREWLEENIPDDEIYWTDFLIDSIECGRDGSSSLIRFLENDCKTEEALEDENS